MSKCWHCGIRYDSEKGRLTLCAESYSDVGRYGDDEFQKMSRSLFVLANTDWLEMDEELLAQSDVGDKLGKLYLRYATWDTVNKLLNKKKDDKL